MLKELFQIFLMLVGALNILWWFVGDIRIMITIILIALLLAYYYTCISDDKED